MLVIRSSSQNLATFSTHTMVEPVEPFPSVGAYEAMFLLLLILRVTFKLTKSSSKSLIFRDGYFSTTNLAYLLCMPLLIMELMFILNKFFEKTKRIWLM
jgi:hypothetical protein